MCNYLNKYCAQSFAHVQAAGETLVNYATDNQVAKSAIEISKTTLAKCDELKDQALEYGEYMGKVVRIWTNSMLPKPAAALVQAAFDSSPFILAYKILPSSVIVAGTLGYVAARTFNESPTLDTIDFRIKNGIGFTHLGYAATNLVTFAITRKPGHLIGALVDSVIAMWMISFPQDENLPVRGCGPGYRIAEEHPSEDQDNTADIEPRIQEIHSDEERTSITQHVASNS